VVVAEEVVAAVEVTAVAALPTVVAVVVEVVTALLAVAATEVVTVRAPKATDLTKQFGRDYYTFFTVSRPRSFPLCCWRRYGSWGV
jgi:hypothetical protein